jgi:protein gp37
MGETTGISWSDATINFWHGCRKVSEGCKFCYMYREKEKYGQQGNEIKRTSANTIVKILKALNLQRMERLAAGNKEPLKIFTCSWSDFFLEEADEWRPAAWNIIRANPQYVWIILTKRMDRAKQCLPTDWGDGWPNVWMVVSVENQLRFDEGITDLVCTPAAVRGISIEPMLGPIDMELGRRYIVIENKQYFLQSFIDWVIVGGESGNETGNWRYRPCEVKWMQHIIDQCFNYDVAVWMKQLGTHIAKANYLSYAGENWDKWPAQFSSLKVRKFPKQKKSIYGKEIST